MIELVVQTMQDIDKNIQRGSIRGKLAKGHQDLYTVISRASLCLCLEDSQFALRVYPYRTVSHINILLNPTIRTTTHRSPAILTPLSSIPPDNLSLSRIPIPGKNIHRHVSLSPSPCESPLATRHWQRICQVTGHSQRCTGEGTLFQLSHEHLDFGEPCSEAHHALDHREGF